MIRHLHCQLAIELARQDIITAAVAFGWGEDETLTAMTEVTDNLILASTNNGELEILLKELKTRTGIESGMLSIPLRLAQQAGC